jgi:hypothetical protein
MVLFLFLTHLGIGIVFTLLCVSRDAGVKFFRFNAGLAALLIAAGFAFRPIDDSGALVSRVSVTALAVFEAAVVLYWLTVGRALASIRWLLRGTAGVAGLVALVTQAIGIASEWGPAIQALTIASFVSSAVFVGGVCTAMIMGHWYLVVPSMQIDHLQSIVKLHIVSMVVRIAVVVAAIVVAVAAWQPGNGPNFTRYVFSVSGVFFWQRVLFGLAGPLLLSYLTWETAKIRSTQSATGILYVDFFTVVVGEALAKYLLLATRVPV